MTPIHRPIHFLRRGQPVTLHGIAPERTLLEVLREDLGCTGTKEGCGEGDCGACTVVLGEARGQELHFSAVNSCIRLAHSIDGLALWTVEDLGADPLITATPAPPACGAQADGPACAATASAPSLHPAQEAMVQCHGSQCGFCTPGFVMSLFGMYQNRVVPGQTISRQQAQEDLSGNLCRCTGYRPILDAAQQMASLPAHTIDTAQVLSKLEQMRQTTRRPEGDLTYISPASLPELLQARAANPHAQVVAGATDVGLWITKQHKQFGQILDVTRAAELRALQQDDHHVHIGAAVTLTDAFAALTAQWPQLHSFASRFAGLPVRNSGTLGGNVANGSPIGDSMPLLIALRAQVVLASVRGERSLPLEDLYTGYRQNVMAPDELVVRITVPRPGVSEALRAYKISKRHDDDISAVCLVINLDIEAGVVRRASIGAGGVAATPARARACEAALTGQPWTEATVKLAAQALQTEFQPLSDMRASAAYRSTVLGNLLQRFWLESQGSTQVSIAQFDVQEVA